MADNLFDDMVASYEPKNSFEHECAIREVMQIFVLAGLNRGGFFEHAAFYGGSCLKIYYGLDRFSEDLDFTLLSPDNAFSLKPYFEAIYDEFSISGREIIITEKTKSAITSINSAFLKDNTQIFDLNGKLMPKVRIKFEIDTDPPPGFETEYNLSMSPYSFLARCYSLPSSFAGKMSALLYRGWRDRIKGRDWYDFEWYVRKGVVMDLGHFNERALQFGKTDERFTADTFKEALREKIRNVDIELVKMDVLGFIDDSTRLDIWSRDYFLKVAELMLIK